MTSASTVSARSGSRWVLSSARNLGDSLWLTFAARTAAGKILAILWPISGFVLLGLEHSVANLYLLPQGALADAQVGWVPGLGNLVWVTLGNILGGAGGVALAYRFAYLRGTG